jgi:hypothetical protein
MGGRKRVNVTLDEDEESEIIVNARRAKAAVDVERMPAQELR